MHIALFGATGGTGRQILSQALAQGHTIAALARDATKLAPSPGLATVQGDVLDPSPVQRCIQGSDTVICALGSHGRKAPVEARGTERILDGMRDAGVRRLIVVSSLGVGESRRQIPALFRFIMDLTLKSILTAKEEQEALVKASGLDWTIVRPGGLTDGPRTGTYRYGVAPAIRSGRISRADVADFVLKQLTDRHFLHQTPAVT